MNDRSTRTDEDTLTLPDAEITRISHMIAGQHICAYDVRPKAAQTASGGGL